MKLRNNLFEFVIYGAATSVSAFIVCQRVQLNQKTKTLSLQIHEFYEHHKNSDINRKCKKQVIKKIQQIIQNTWPRATAMVFGSVATGFDIQTSDIDLCIKNDPKLMPPHSVLKCLIPKIKENFLCRIMPIFKAKIPILKCVIISDINDSKIRCDIIVQLKDEHGQPNITFCIKKRSKNDKKTIRNAQNMLKKMAISIHYQNQPALVFY